MPTAPLPPVAEEHALENGLSHAELGGEAQDDIPVLGRAWQSAEELHAALARLRACVPPDDYQIIECLMLRLQRFYERVAEPDVTLDELRQILEGR